MNPSMYPSSSKASAMTTAALLCSLLALCSSCCIYAAVPFGALGMIFALLSKGGENTMPPVSRIAFWIGLSAILLTIILTMSALFAAIQQYGSLEGMIKAYNDLYQQLYRENPIQ